MIEDRMPYHDEKEWEEYVAKLSDLYLKIEEVFRLRDKLLEEAGDRTVDALIRENKIWEYVLFGGLNEKGYIEENGLARFYSEILGFGISEDDLKRIVSYLKEGIDIESASSNVTPKLRGTEFTKLIASMKKKLMGIFDALEREPPKTSEVSFSSPVAGVKAVAELLSVAKQLLPLHNPLSMFIISIRSTPRFYLEGIYTRLFTDEVQELLSKYGISLRDIVSPDLPLEQEKKKRTVVGLEPRTVGHRIYEVIFDCYQLFQIRGMENFFRIEDEFEKYLVVYSERLKNTIPLDELKDVYGALTSIGYSYGNRFNSLVVQQPFRVYEIDTQISGGYLRPKSGWQKELSYTEFIAFIAPLSFCGFATLDRASEKEVKCRVIMGWDKK
ncbi:hypothetical protein E3E36_10065 [Thermococcus sp. M36]|uniref:hypothetical protein n=1 Tax=Thermococcus sp. M36 TaxID=1638261 RepID=UPI00143921E8|nr:hypothetical protein [Thermococcus sp. M36]NJE06479.1 hypothetical protein [Thermococcus sp. M36]